MRSRAAARAVSQRPHVPESFASSPEREQRLAFWIGTHTPRQLGRQWLKPLRARALSRAIHSLAKHGFAEPLPASLLDDAIFGWGNAGWSADRAFLSAVVRHAAATRGPIVECGTGLTTLMLAVVAARTGQRVTSLEHEPRWTRQLCDTLARFGLDAARIDSHPLQPYDGYHWYAPDRDELPRDIALVVCDGPPGATPGGRYGAVPQLLDRMAPGCTILLDDVYRREERQILERWARETGARIATGIETSRYGVLVMPDK